MAHLHHIGVRVLLRNVRGEDDETRPDAVLVESVTWTTVVAYEVAVITGAAGLLSGKADLVELAAVFGFASFVTMVANLSAAYYRARRRFA